MIAANFFGPSTHVISIPASGSSQPLVFPFIGTEPGAAANANFDNGDLDYDITLTANCAFSLTGGRPGVLQKIMLLIGQDATAGWLPSFPASIKWLGALPIPNPLPGRFDQARLWTMNSGATVFGRYLNTAAHWLNVAGAGVAQTTVMPAAITSDRVTIARVGPIAGNADVLGAPATSAVLQQYYINRAPNGLAAIGIYYTNTSGATAAVQVTGTLPAGSFWPRWTLSSTGTLAVDISLNAGSTWVSFGANGAGNGAPAADTAALLIGAASGGNPANTYVDGVTMTNNGAVVLDIDFTALATDQTLIMANPGGAITLTGNARIN